MSVESQCRFEVYFAKFFLDFNNGVNKIGIYRENAIAIESEASDPNGGNVCLFSVATCISQCNLHSSRRAFAR